MFGGFQNFLIVFLYLLPLEKYKYYCKRFFDSLKEFKLRKKLFKSRIFKFFISCKPY